MSSGSAIEPTLTSKAADAYQITFESLYLIRGWIMNEQHLKIVSLQGDKTIGILVLVTLDDIF